MRATWVAIIVLAGSALPAVAQMPPAEAPPPAYDFAAKVADRLNARLADAWLLLQLREPDNKSIPELADLINYCRAGADRCAPVAFAGRYGVPTTIGLAQRTREESWLNTGQPKYLPEMAIAAADPTRPVRGLFGATLDGKDVDPIASYFVVDAISAHDPRRANTQPGYLSDVFCTAARDAWIARQGRDGGWGAFSVAAKPADESTFAATAAGLLVVDITDSALFPDVDVKDHKADNADPAMRTAMAWLEKNGPRVVANILLGNDRHPARTAFWFVKLVDRFGYAPYCRKAWIDAIGERLMKLYVVAPPDLAESAYTVFYLSSWQRNIACTKLDYSGGDKNVDWNNRPRDLRKLTGSVYSGHVTFQTLRPEFDSLDDFLLAPLVLMCGDQALHLTPAQLDKLRNYVELGGEIIGNVDFASPTFGESFDGVMQKLFPSCRLGPPSNLVVINLWRPSPLEITADAHAITNGLRDFAVLIPNGDPSQKWQTDELSWRFRPAKNAPLLSRMAQRNQIVYGEKPIRIARLKIGDTWNFEPALWYFATPMFHNDYSVNIEFDVATPGVDDLSRYDVAHLTGTTPVKFTPDQRNAIRKFVDGGGTLMVDAIAGSKPFADSARDELEETLGFKCAVALTDPPPADHPAFAWMKQEVVEYRRALSHDNAGLLDPHFRAMIANDGHVAVLFSREDLATGLLGIENDDIPGYTPKTSRQIVGNLLREIATRKNAAPATRQ